MNEYGIESFINWCDSMTIAKESRFIQALKNLKNKKSNSDEVDENYEMIKSEIDKLSKEYDSRYKSKALTILRKTSKQYKAEGEYPDYTDEDLREFNFQVDADDPRNFNFPYITQSMFFDGIDKIINQYAKDLEKRIPGSSVGVCDDTAAFTVSGV